MIIHVLWVEKKAGRATITHRQLGEETRFFFWRDSGDERQIDIEVEVVRVVWTYVHTYMIIHVLWVEKKAGRATITHRQLGEETRFFFWRDSGDERQVDIEVEVVRVVWTYVHTYIYIYI